jgi:hypothetical protein
MATQQDRPTQGSNRGATRPYTHQCHRIEVGPSACGVCEATPWVGGWGRVFDQWWTGQGGGGEGACVRARVRMFVRVQPACQPSAR